MALVQIIRLEGMGNYTNFHFADGSELLAALSLKVYAQRVPPGSFMRPHRKHLYIEAISGPRSEVVLTTGERIPVARRRVEVFRREWRELVYPPFHPPP
jgi:two-component system, LytTR family, response regulator